MQQQLTHWLMDTMRDNPTLGIGVGVATVAVLFLLNRKPRIQRDADARLASIRREKSDDYNKTRPLR
jgi:hypothetical protein